MDELRAHCRGVVALHGRLAAWQRETLRSGAELAGLIEEHGSPINLIEPSLLAGHADELSDAGQERGVSVRVFFARKANKALALVDAALAAGHGVDVASERELQQVLDRAPDPDRIIVTAAVKPRRLIELAVAAGVVISLDNLDEVALVTKAAAGNERPARVALRLRVDLDRPSRFGLSLPEWTQWLAATAPPPELQIEGVHFHVAGYDPEARVSGIGLALELVQSLRSAGHVISWIDIGGGIPMCYLDGAEDWDRFWAEHRAGLLSGSPLTWQGRGLGLQVTHQGVEGEPAVYPMWQPQVRGAWLHAILDAQWRDGSIANALRSAGLSLHLEPGRALLDGCGMTVARVETRKRLPDGTWAIALAMNRTQCRSAADDFLIDPLLVPGVPRGEPTGAIEGYLVGAYCIEAELLTWRRLWFPHGVAVGDLVAFVNTAGYQMHILESASHQIPLAANLVRTSGGWGLDAIDRGIQPSGSKSRS